MAREAQERLTFSLLSTSKERELIRRPVRYLLLAIIYMAWRDLHDPRVGDEVRATARQFLASDDYQAFCDYLGIRPSERHRFRHF